MTMASFLRGKPIMEDYTPSAAYSAGDVIVLGGLPCVAHEDNPVSSGIAITKDALAVMGGIYQMLADAAYPVGTFVSWNPATQMVTATPTGATAAFGVIVGGPTDQASDGGPTGSGSLCSVLHSPFGDFGGGTMPLSVTTLTAAADAIPAHNSHTYVVNRAGVDAMTLAAPTPTTDDGVVIEITSNTAFAHTLTATGLLQTGSASVNVATFAAQKGAGLELMAYQGKWNVISAVGITFS